MKKLFEIMGVEFERELKAKDYAVLTWISIAITMLSVKFECVPMWVVLAVLVNFAASIFVGSKVLPEIKDDDENA
jgi:hypothetical protein